MRRKEFLASVCVLLWLAPLPVEAQSEMEISTGFSVGIARLEGDLRNPGLSPYVAGTLRLAPTPFFSVGGELGFSELRNDDRPGFKSTIIPFELDGRIDFLPFASISPFAFVGGGGVYWSASQNGQVVVLNGAKQQGLDSFLKTGGGLEFRLNDRVGVEVGGVFRYSLTDALDQRFSGDERDQVLSAFVGLSYRFPLPRNDRDRDGVPDDLDLDIEVAEDADGFLDHDGVPEEGPAAELAALGEIATRDHSNSIPPVVIHRPIHRAEQGQTLNLKATIASTGPLRKASLLYRRLGHSEWEVSELTAALPEHYVGTIPGAAVTSPAIEYAIVALGEDLRSVGYSGLPKRPNRVKVYGKGRTWRYIGGLVSTFSWTAATYLVLRKQQ